MIGADPETFFFHPQFGGLIPTFDPHAYADYVRAAKNPSVIHAMCEDYRAGAGYDRLLDEADRKAGKQIACPTQVLWGARGALGAWYDTLAIWREWAPDVQGRAVDCGHFIPEERPAETLALLRAFFAG